MTQTAAALGRGAAALPKEWGEATTYSDWHGPAHAAAGARRWSSALMAMIQEAEDEDDEDAGAELRRQLNAFPRPGHGRTGSPE